MRRKNKIVSKNFDTLEIFAKFRNLEAHSNDLAPHFADPHLAIVQIIEEIANDIDPEAKAFDCAIKSDRIYTAKLIYNAKKVIRHMIDRTFTHVPILDDKEKLTGVFSESSIFNYFGSHDEIILDNSTTLAHLEQ